MGDTELSINIIHF